MGKENLFNFSDIFTSRLFRIPDYQRGYSWDEEQLTDFWEDLLYCKRLMKEYHYTGMLIIEQVKNNIYKTWYSDNWCINQGYVPYFIVDGQQRLTTCIILIKCIIEIASKRKISELKEGVSIKFVEEKYIKRENENLISYLFGYYKDENSNNWLKEKILNSANNLSTESLYTKKLLYAKNYFLNKLNEIITNNDSKEDAKTILKNIYDTLTDKFVFNLYTIEEDKDVFMIFETMNNRGKALSTLELLKNRLIYLSTLFETKQRDSALTLREQINSCWKTIYHYLGKNPETVSPDDDFLYNHWIMYFPYNRKLGKMFKKYLLDVRFSPYRLINKLTTYTLKERDNESIQLEEDELFIDENENDNETDNGIIMNEENTKLEIKEIIDYLDSLKLAVEKWFFIHNPTHNDCNFSESEKKWLERLKRLSFGYFRPLILSCFMVNEQTNKKREELLELIEKYNFVLFRLSFMRSNTGNTTYYSYARKIYGKTLKKNEKKAEVDEVLAEMNDFIEKNIDLEKFNKFIKDRYQKQKDGFYGWGGLKYFLYEYELKKIESGIHSQKHIRWSEFTIQKEKSSIEHIFPLTPKTGEWPKELEDLNTDDKSIIQNSLGNLLPLKLAKNIKQQNHSFKEKVTGLRNGIQIEGLTGYQEGSYSEQEVVNMAKDYIWDIKKIENRGKILLDFLNTRWGIDYWKTDEEKKEILGLNLIKQEEGK